MGLNIEVGYLADMLQNDEEGAEWFRENTARLNAFLGRHGFKPHVEPERVEVFSADMHGYSGIHYLRRVAAHLSLRGSLPEPGDSKASDDPVVQQYYQGAREASAPRFDHLIFHSDAEGYYLPRDFPNVLTADDESEIAGGAVGSSQQLLKETEALGWALGLPLDLDPEAPEVWDACESQGEGEVRWKRYGVESYVCLRLYHAAKHSIAHGALIVFC